MRKILLLILLLVSQLSYSQNISFQATEKGDVYLASEWDYIYNKMKSPINISISESKISMQYESGKVYAEFKISSMVEIKNTVEGGETKELILAYAFEEDGLTSYIVYEYKNDYTGIKKELKLPQFVKGVVFSYSYFK